MLYYATIYRNKPRNAINMDSHTISKAIKIIRFKLGISQSELASRIGISPGSVYKYEAGKQVPAADVMEKIKKLSPDKDDEGPLNIGNDMDILTQSLQRTIELQDEKILVQYKRIKELEDNQLVDHIGNEVWTNIIPDLELTVKVKINFKHMSVEKKYIKISDLKPLSKYIGYSVKELHDIYTTNQWYETTDNLSEIGGVNKIYSKETIQKLSEMSKIIIKSIGFMRAVVGEHYIPVPMELITKDGSLKQAMSYNKLNIKSMTGVAKIVFIRNESA